MSRLKSWLQAVAVTLSMSALLATGYVAVYPLQVQAQGTSLIQAAINVMQFGAVPEDPSADNTQAFQKAIDAAALRGGGIVWVPFLRFYFNGSLVLKTGVVLAGEGRGPYDVMISPILNRQGPTLLPRAIDGEAFILLQGANTGIEDLIIAYPDQLPPDHPGIGNTGPKVYPPTILVKNPASSRINRVYIPNSYHAISLFVGRVYIQDCHIGAYKYGVTIDDTWDVVRIQNTVFEPFWDWGFTFPQSVDFWVLNNGTGITARRSDGLMISDVLIFGQQTGILFEKSQTPTDPNGGVSGHGSNINLDSVRNGVIAFASEERVGFVFTNLLMGPYWDAPGHAIWVGRKDKYENCPPRISVVGGSIRHQWAVKPNGEDWAFRLDEGDGRELHLERIIGYDLGPRL